MYKIRLKKLYLSVNWNSGKYSEKLYESVKNSTYKIFAYDDDKLISLITDNCINLFISYLVINPKYQNQKIGMILLNKLVSKRKFNRIQLINESKDKNFYLKNGFIEDGVSIFKIKR